jgi:hypothetical protein
MTLWLRTFWFFVCLLGLIAAEPALDPVPVCQATTNWKDYDGKSVAVLGRYSFREAGAQKGRWLDQEGCDGKSTHAMVRLALDPRTGPRLPDQVAIDERALEGKMAGIRQHTSLGKFRFGSADYDRWAVVIGRMERHGEDDFLLTYRGDGAVFFLADR